MPTLLLPSWTVTQVEGEASAARLVLLNRLPAPDGDDVPVDALVSLQILDVGADGVDATSVQVYVDDGSGEVLAYDGSGGGFQPGYDGADSAAAALGSDARTITIDRTTSWPSEATVTVRVVADVVGGGEPIDETYAWEVEDLTAPQVTAAVALDALTVRLSFNEPIHLVDAEALVITAVDVPAVPLSVVSAVVEGSDLVVTLDQRQSPRRRYQITAPDSDAVTDLAGNGVDAGADGAELTGYHNPPQGRRFELIEFLPGHLVTDDDLGEYTKFVGCLQDVVDVILGLGDGLADLMSPDRCPSVFLDALLYQLGNPFALDDLTLTVSQKRRLADEIVALYQKKGTEPGLEAAARLFLGVDVTVVPLTSEVMQLGVSELNDSWVLGTADSRALYSFHVEVTAALTDEQDSVLRQLVELLKPAHTHYLGARLATSATVWVLGSSALGIDTTLS